jgi:flagellar hook assembly protein FlgD
MSRVIFSGIAVAATVFLVLAGCQTAKPKPAEESVIQTESSGFSPKAEKGHNTIDFNILFGNKEAVNAWKVEIGNKEGAQRTISGDKSDMPSSITWDGLKDDKTPAPEGAFTATLSVDYGKTFLPSTAVSNGFILDVTPPTGEITFDPPQFTPSGEGVASPVKIILRARQPVAKIDSWTLDVFGPDGKLFTSFNGKGPKGEESWDGMGMGGGIVTPATTYSVAATIRDEFGNRGQIKATLSVSDIALSTEEASVRPMQTGFSPNSEDPSMRAIDLSLVFGHKEALKLWKLSLSHATKGVERIFNGDSSSLREKLSWDGTTSLGEIAPEGSYSAILSLDYGNTYKPVLVKSAPFILDVNPPMGFVTATPAQLVPDGKGGFNPVTFTIFASSTVASIKDWTMNVLAPDGSTVMSTNDNWPKNSILWDGTTRTGGTVEPGKKYSIFVKVRDEYSNAGTAKGRLGAGELPAGELPTVEVAELPETPGQVAIAPLVAGFSPNGDGTLDLMQFSVSYGMPEAVYSWKVQVEGIDGKVQKTFSGDTANLPNILSWDGRDDDGALAPEGRYTARLQIDYGMIFKPAGAASASFVLDVTPPTGSIALSSPLFSPVEASDTITLTLNASSQVAKIDAWKMDIFDPAGNLFRSFEGKWPKSQAIWDGKSINGDMVDSAEEYAIVAKVRDEFGNVGTIDGSVPIDILVEKTATGYRILGSRIFFKPFTADYRDVPAEIANQNLSRLDALARKLKKFPGYRIKLVGHAVMIHWDNPALGKAEQEKVLIPLSRNRAEALKQAMIDRGLEGSMIETVGVGASDQLVPDSDFANRWRNRRVAFFLEK